MMVKEHINSMVNEIIDCVTNRKVDVFELCEKLYYSPEQFINLLSNPVMNASVYIEILEVMRGER